MNKKNNPNPLMITIIILLLTASLSAQILPDLLAPETIAADNQYLYITQREEVLIFSIQNFSLIRRLGRPGEGPQEFKLMEDKPLQLFVEGPDIIVNSWNKISIFKKTGPFKTELRSTEPLTTNYIPLPDHFVAMTIRTQKGARQKVLSLYTHTLKKQKEIFLRTTPKQKNHKIPILQKTFQYTVHAGTLIISADNTFTIYLFNPDGTPHKKIHLPNYQQRPFTKTDKQNHITLTKRNAANTALYNRLKDRIQYPTHYPAIQTIHAAHNKIYAITWKKTGQATETHRFTLTGKKLPQIPLSLHYQDPFTPAPHTIQNNTLYQLTETPDTTWQLHTTPLN